MTDLNDDIARYLNGQMSPAEMHALEKRALDDPFLADALAGASSVSSDEFSADVMALQNLIQHRISSDAAVVSEQKGALADPMPAGQTEQRDSSGKTIPFTEQGNKGATVTPLDGSHAAGRQVQWWSWPTRIAAGLLLLAAASAIFVIKQDQRSERLALNESKGQSSEESVVAPSSPADRSVSDPSGNATDQNETEQTQSSTSPTADVGPPDSETARSGRTSGNAGQAPAESADRLALEQSPAVAAGDVTSKAAPGKVDPARQAISAPPAATAQSKDGEAATEKIADGPSDAEGPPAERTERRERLAYEQRAENADAEKTDEIKTGEAEVSKLKEGRLNDDATRPSVAQGSDSRARYAEAKKANETSKKVFSGKVVDDDGTPIPGVNVVVKGTNTGTVTDIQGNYQLSLDKAHPTLVFSFIGYANTEQTAESARPLTVKLEEDLTELSEVVVTGYGGVQREIDPMESTVELANPVGGNRAFKKYLERNLQYPQQALLNNVEGRVTVQFSVETTGLLTDFNVIKGLGSGCDEELVRLIRTGPKWNPTKRDEVAEKSQVRVRMKFQLPKEKKKK